jgi:hypothetical protein
LEVTLSGGASAIAGVRKSALIREWASRDKHRAEANLRDLKKSAQVALVYMGKDNDSVQDSRA